MILTIGIILVILWLFGVIALKITSGLFFLVLVGAIIFFAAHLLNRKN